VCWTATSVHPHHAGWEGLGLHGAVGTMRGACLLRRAGLAYKPGGDHHGMCLTSSCHCLCCLCCCLQLIVYKMKPKKHYRRKNGHRQELTKFMVTKVGA
jgi:hypothetical protein